MHHKIIQFAAFLGALSVALGAFAAHGLRDFAPDQAVTVFETGVRYQFYHVFALLAAGILYERYPCKYIWTAAVLFVLGIVLFSGSLYLLTFKISGNLSGFSWVGPVTPVGGVSFILGWICLGFGVSASHRIHRHHHKEAEE